MIISKTLFKNLSRCRAYKELLFNDKVEEIVEDNVYKILESIDIDEEGSINKKQIEAMMPYFNKVEDLALVKATEEFDGIVDDQKSFSYKEGSDFEFYTRGDICIENDSEVTIIEVKASTTSDYLKLGYTEKKVFCPLFERGINDVLTLKEDLYKSKPYSSKYSKQRSKLLDRYTSVGRHVYDVAFQRHIIEASGVFRGKKVNYYLALLNSEYTFDGIYDGRGEAIYRDIDGHSLINFVDVNSLTKELQPKIKEEVSKVISNSSEAKRCDIGKFCERKKVTECNFLKKCWGKALDSGSIVELIDNHHGFKDETGDKVTTIELINRGISSIKELPYDWLTRDKNLIQKDCIENNETYMNKGKITDGISVLNYPIYHLDFETFPCPLPRFKGEKPYSQSLFQFSIHIEREPGECDMEKDHLEFLAKDNGDHREEVAKKLLEYIKDDGGSIVVYNRAFEMTRIKELAEAYPTYSENLLKLNERVFDLLHLLKGNKDLYTKLGYSENQAKEINYYHNSLKGSYSIKSVLPVLSDLSYEGMVVGNGIEAYVNYSKLDELRKGELMEYDRIIEGLRNYCKLDTWAMYEILNKLRILSSDKLIENRKDFYKG